MEVVAELLKLGATVDAATKVRPTPVNYRSSADVTEDYIWIQHKFWLQCRIKPHAPTLLLYSTTTVNVLPSLGFHIG